MQTKTLALAGALIASLVASRAASAASIIGLVDGKTLVWVDPATRKVTGKADIKGAANIVGIDVRPADGMLYAVSQDGGIYTVDAKTGAATMKSKLSETLKPGVTVTVDFNPVADRLRVITSEGVNLRVNVDDGKATVDGALKFKDGDANAGKTPMVVAGAYTNSANPKPSATALYDIDATTGSLVSQAPPNDGILNTIGSLGIKLNGAVELDAERTDRVEDAVVRRCLRDQRTGRCIDIVERSRARLRIGRVRVGTRHHHRRFAGVGIAVLELECAVDSRLAVVDVDAQVHTFRGDDTQPVRD